jgi:hypothetical protein
MSWVEDIFNKDYAPYLNYSKRNHRREGFKIIFSELEKINKSFYRIVETGTTRKDLKHRLAWKDGMSTLMFENFVNYYNGIVDTVDIDIDACKKCKLLVGDKVRIHCCDSLDFLKNITEQIDFYYLDSWDVDRHNPLPSQKHHLQEFKIIEPFLQNCIVGIDDNFMQNNINVGKGKLVEDYLRNKGINPIYKGYQLVYKF